MRKTLDIQRSRTFLFVPATRPDRIDKALAASADAVIVDLEDAVSPDAKECARAALAAWLASSDARPVLVRVNGVDTEWHAADLAMCRASLVHGIVLPKAESDAALTRVHMATGKPVLPIVESAVGVSQLQQIAKAAGCARLVFGKLDLAIDLGLELAREDSEEIAFLPYRAQLVLASRLAALPPPVDGIFTAIDDSEELSAYSRRARRDGFGAVLLIHPRQVATVAAAFVPADAEIAWARRVLAAAVNAGGGATVVDGRMIDAPVMARANRLLAAAGLQGA